MKNQDNEIRKSILNAINDHIAEISRYRKMLQLITNSFVESKGLDNLKSHAKPVNHDVSPLGRPTAQNFKEKRKVKAKRGRPRKYKGKYKSVRNLKRKISRIDWDKSILPLLKKAKKPMSAIEISNILFKNRKPEYRKILHNRIHSGLRSLKRKNKIVSSKVGKNTCYVLKKK